jgi:hypothetical protein
MWIEGGVRKMGSYRSDKPVHAEFMIGYAKVADIVFVTFFTMLVFGFYMAHYALSTGFFTSGFTPLLASVFFCSVLFTIITAITKAATPRKEVAALVELIGATLFVITAAWFYATFPLDFAQLSQVVPAQFKFLFTWITNDIGRIIVALTLVGGVIALAVDVVKLAWRVHLRQSRMTHTLRTEG